MRLPGAPGVAGALEPDNRAAPPWLSVSCSEVEGYIECLVFVDGCGEPRRILSLRNTIDDLLRSYKAAFDAVRRSGEGGPGRA